MDKARSRPTFSLRAYRELRRFEGELTATAAGSEVALRNTVGGMAESKSPDPWAVLASNYGIRVNGLVPERLIISCSRMHFVSLYSGWDGFIRALRSEYRVLFGSDWQHQEGDSPFDEIYRNSPMPKSDLERRIDLRRVKVLEYYRKVRNAIVHPAESTSKTAADHLLANKEDMVQVRESYGMHSPPNLHDKLSFHDIKLLCRLTLDVGAVISETFDPGDSRLKALVPIQNWLGLSQDEARFSSAVRGYLRTEFGLHAGRAEQIASQLMVR